MYNCYLINVKKKFICIHLKQKLWFHSFDIHWTSILMILVMMKVLMILKFVANDPTNTVCY